MGAALLALTVQLSLSGVALGQRRAPAATAARSAASERAEARRRYRKGVALFGDRDYKAALVEFRRAQQLRPHPRTLFNIATCHSHLGRYLRAIAAFDASLTGRPRLGARLRRKARREVARLTSLLAIIKLRINVEAAALVVDGEPRKIGRRATLRVPAGAHTLEVRARGYAPETRRLELAGGMVSDLEINLTAGARLKVDATPARARVYLAGKPVGRTPYVRFVAPGAHKLTVEHDGYVPWHGEIQAEAVRPINVGVRLRSPDEGLEQYWFWSAAGATAALGVAAIVTGAQVGQLEQDYSDLVHRIKHKQYSGQAELRQWQQQGRELAAEMDQHATLCNVFIGLTAGAVVGTAALGWFTRFGKVESRARISLAPGGVVLSGRFQ